MPWGVAASVAGAVVSSSLNKPKGGSASQAADPFAGERYKYQQQLDDFMTGPFNADDPSYKWRMDQGLEATQRSYAARGMTNSGNVLAALTEYGQNMASTEYSNQFNRLAQLAGANVGSPAAAGQILYNQQQQQSAGAGAIGNAVGGAIKDFGSGGGFSNMFGGGGEYGAGPGINYDEADF